MSENSAIEWTHHSFNPWWGCQEVSPGCKNCYARTDAKRYAPRMSLWGPNSERRFFGDDHWHNPVKWNTRCGKAGIRERVFCASMADVFDNHPGVGAARAKLFHLIRNTPHLDWLLLTKRIGNVMRHVAAAADWHFDHGDRDTAGWLTDWYKHNIPPLNVWLGASVVNQEEADRDIEKLLETPARIRFLSCEPLLGPLNLERFLRQSIAIDWVIVGGESGHSARSMNISWAVTILADCFSYGVPAFMKQLGARVNWDDNHPARPIINAKGGDIREFPVSMRVREFPEIA